MIPASDGKVGKVKKKHSNGQLFVIFVHHENKNQEDKGIFVYVWPGVLPSTLPGGEVFSRSVLCSPHDGKTISEPSDQSYGDDSDYGRRHFPTVFDLVPKGTRVPALPEE